jgi:hypothetical protein
MKGFTHLDDNGAANAIAEGRITMSSNAATAIRERSVVKGDVLTVARVAGVIRYLYLEVKCHEVEADRPPAQRLRLSHDVAERYRRAGPSPGHAGDPDDPGGVRRLDARAMGRSQGAAAAVAR